MESLYEEDKQTAIKFYRSKCQHADCDGIYHTANYPRKPRGIPAYAEEFFAFIFSFCCSICGQRFTPESVRFLGRRVYAAFFIMTTLYPPAEELQEKLLELPPKTLAPITHRRWIIWWDSIIPKSPIWKKLAGLLPANLENQFLPIFIIQQFIQKYSVFKNSIFAMLKFISPMSIPANYPTSDRSILWNDYFTQKMLLQKLKVLPYLKRSD
jgi:hypothetical protein